jgi:hypothetical protein
MADDETTEKLFPPPERPIPLRPSIREEFSAHHIVIREELKTWRGELAAALARLAPPLEPEPQAPAVGPPSVVDKAKAGALAGLRYGGVALALGEVAAQLAAALGHPEIAGPVQTLLRLLGGS